MMNVSIPVRNINSYISYVKMFPVLTLERELELGKQMSENNDLDAAQTLILHNLQHVLYTALKYKGYGLPVEDLIQEGNIGLMKAVRKYDYKRGFKVISFAIHAITAEIQMYVLNNWSLVKVTSTKPLKKLFFNLRSMKPDCDSMNQEQLEQIAQTLNVPIKDVQMMETRMSHCGRDVNLTIETDDGDEVERSDAMLCDEYEPCNVLLNQEQLQATEAIHRAIDQLDDRSKDILISRYLTDNPVTFPVLAERYGVSHQRIAQIETAAINKIKSVLNV